MKTEKRTVLSLFSGCGGLDLGFVQAGYKIVAAYDFWEPAVDTHLLNSHLLGKSTVLQKSLNLTDGEIQLADLPKVEVIIGGPPCQGFSFAGKQLREDPRNRLYSDFVEIVRHIQPTVFLMENVPGMKAMALDQVKADFTAAGYRVTVTVAKAVDFGLAQRRKRLIIVGFRKDLRKTYTPPEAGLGYLSGASAPKSIIEVIGDLPAPVAIDKESTFLSELAPHLQSHAFRPLPASVQKFLRHVPNGGCFRDAPRACLPQRLRTILDDPAKYRSPRLFPKPNAHEAAQTIPADTNPSLGGVLAPDLIYPNGCGEAVIASKYTKKGLYTSPLPSRRLTPREAARLQGFPDNFLLEGSLTTQFRLVGNAVPVPLAFAFAKSIAQQMDDIESHKIAEPKSLVVCRSIR